MTKVKAPEPYWAFKAPPTPVDDPHGQMTRDEWESLSLGMRRQIQRDHDLWRAAALRDLPTP